MSRSVYNIYSTTKQAWDAMYRAIEHAQTSIYWQVYIFVDDDVGNRFFSLLEEKAKRGVEVKLVIDYWGSFALSRKRVDQLRRNGVDVRLFQERRNKLRGFWQRFSVRVHRKVLVVDEKIGFIGGVNIDKSTSDWLDIHVSVRGQAIRALLRSFAKLYIICGGPKEAVLHLLRHRTPRKKPRDEKVNVLFDHPRRHYSSARRKYLEALKKAKKRVILFTPYYFPDKHFLKELWRAKKRGVRVDLLIPFRTDLRLATYVAYAWFALMKHYGVKVHLLKKMMHGKGVIVDDEWAMVGSSNIDHVSFNQNYEANLQLKDRRAVRKLTRIVSRWLEDAEKLENTGWLKRGRWHRFKEALALKLYKYWFNIK